MGTFDGKVAFITGIARAQGRSHALRLASGPVGAPTRCRSANWTGSPRHGGPRQLRVPARLSPKGNVLFAKTTASAQTPAYKEQVRAAVAEAAELPAGPVRLELAFVVGPRRNWLGLWKQTIDSLDPLLGRTYLDRAWHPLDGRITELGMHLTVDPAARYEVVVGIVAAPNAP
jgi:NAD(P)-dependent dehydrogenase (short-subunit alcohol dehydrogenase family)